MHFIRIGAMSNMTEICVIDIILKSFKVPSAIYLGCRRIGVRTYKRTNVRKYERTAVYPYWVGWLPPWLPSPCAMDYPAAHNGRCHWAKGSGWARLTPSASSAFTHGRLGECPLAHGLHTIAYGRGFGPSGQGLAR